MSKRQVLILIGSIVALSGFGLYKTTRLKEMWDVHNETLDKGDPSISKQVTHEENNFALGSRALPKCILGASHSYSVPADIVIGIISVEGGHSGQEVGPNYNGTYDLGIMQVNSLWVPKLARIWHVDYRTAYNLVRDSGCENIYVGTWILKQSIHETGSVYGGIAYYHSGTHGVGADYVNKVVGMGRKKAMAISQ